MKARIRTLWDKIFFTPSPLPPGTYQTVLEMDGNPYRLHLRIESRGMGTLIINASTVLHLNPTAAEIAFYLVNQTPVDQIADNLMKRYQVSKEDAARDIEDFKIRIEALVKTPDLDPETFLDMERIDLHSEELSTPIRLDCALTYQTSEGTSGVYAPVTRVKRLLDSEEWKAILTKAWNAGIPHVIFTGGEPTLRPDLVELIQYAEILGQVTGLITDGLRLTDSEYFHELLNAGLDHLMIILQSEDDQSWESLRDAINEDIFVTVHLTVNDRNKKAINSILAKLRSIGITSLSLSATNENLSTELTTASRLASEQEFSQVYDLPVPYSLINPFSIEMENTEASKKGAGRSWVYVEPDGDVLLGQGSDRCIGNFLSDPWETISGNRKVEPQR